MMRWPRMHSDLYNELESLLKANKDRARLTVEELEKII